MGTPFKMKGWSPLKQDWESTMTSLTDIKSEHQSTLQGFRESGLSEDNPDVKSVVSKLKQVDVDITAHENKGGRRFKQPSEFKKHIETFL